MGRRWFLRIRLEVGFEPLVIFRNVPKDDHGTVVMMPGVSRQDSVLMFSTKEGSKLLEQDFVFELRDQIAQDRAAVALVLFKVVCLL